MNEQQEQKLNETHKGLIELKSVLLGINGEGGFIRRIEESLGLALSNQDQMITKKECKIIRNGNDKTLDRRKSDFKFNITTGIAIIAILIAVVSTIISIFK